MRLTQLMLVAAALFPRACPLLDDQARIQGTWRAVSWKDGEAAVEDERVRMIDMKWTFKGDTLSTTGNFQGFGEPGSAAWTETFKLDPSTKPKTIKFQDYYLGKPKGVHSGTYKFRGERLVIRQRELLLEFERVKP